MRKVTILMMLLLLLHPLLSFANIYKQIRLNGEKALSIEQGKVNAYSVSAQKTGHTGIRSNGKSESANGPISPEGNISPTAKI